MTGHSGRINSAVVIARLLESEGFSPETANAVRRYANRRMGFTRRQRLAWKARNKAFSVMAATLSESQKLLLGRWIATRQKAAFDAGLRIGLMAFAVENDKAMPNEDVYLGQTEIDSSGDDQDR